MNKILDFIACTSMTLFELIAVIIVAMLIQLIVYRITGVSLFYEFTKLVFKADKYVTAKFN